MFTQIYNDMNSKLFTISDFFSPIIIPYNHAKFHLIFQNAY